MKTEAPKSRVLRSQVEVGSEIPQQPPTQKAARQLIGSLAMPPAGPRQRIGCPQYEVRPEGPPQRTVIMPDGKKTRGKPSGDKIVRNATSASVATAQPAELPASGEIYDVAKLASKHGLSLADA